jgi:molecular chaperone DnaK
MTVVGIDLGTTNTVVAAVRDGQASALQDEFGHALVPSVVSFHPNGTVLVGRPAKERRLIDPRNTIYSIKRLIGRSWESEEVRRARLRFPFDMREGPGQAALVVARNETYTLPEISAFVLRKAKAVAELALGTSIERAVITVPANFNDLQRAATKVAGRVAGLEVLRILNEPTAAALAYGYGKGASERIAVYDFGGGTFDVTLLDLADNVFEVLATAGNTFLGGDDIDIAIAERICEAYLKQHRYDPRSERTGFERVRLAAEELKVLLSNAEEASVQISDVGHGLGGKPLSLLFSMTRAEFERLATPIVDRTFDVCREALNIARLSAGDMKEILLVGGSTRIPLVRRRVEEFFGREIKAHLNPDEVVAIGAAIQANALSGMERRRGTVPPAPVVYGRGTQPAGRGTAPPSAQGPATSPGLGGGRRKQPSLADMEGSQPRLRLSSLPPQDPPLEDLGPNTKPFSRQPTTTADNLAPYRPKQPTLPLDPSLGQLGQAPERRMKTGVGLGPVQQPPAPPPQAAPSPPVTVAPVIVPRGIDKATLVSADAAAEQALAQASVPAPSRTRHEESVAMEIGDGELEYATDPGPAPPQAWADDEDETAVLPAPELPAVPAGPAAAGATFVGPHSFNAPPQPPQAPTRAFAPEPPLAAPQAPLAPPWTSDLPAAPAAHPGTWSSGTPHAVAPPSVRPMAAAPVLVDVTPLTLCVETVNGYCDPIIERNTPVPCEQTREFATAQDNQTVVRVRVGQGESSRFAENTILGELELSGLRPAPRGKVQVAVTFALDTSGMLNVSARDVATGRVTSAQVRLVGLPEAGDVAGLMARHAMYRTQ